MGLRDRIAGDPSLPRSNGDGDGDGVSYYRRRLLEEVNLSEIAELSSAQRRARLERVVGRMVSREGARELAVNTTDLPKDHPYRDAANRDLPKAWRKDAKIEVDEDDPVTVNVKLVVPAVLPGLRSPFKVSDHASTSVEDDPLPPSQTKSTPGSKS